MDASLERQLLEAEYRTLLKILLEQGAEVPTLDLSEVSNEDLATVVRRFRNLARTPRG